MALPERKKKHNPRARRTGQTKHLNFYAQSTTKGTVRYVVRKKKR
jgi:hypothetical protein